jgi:hypothetical protein
VFSEGHARNVTFVGYCRSGKWYIAARIGRRPVRRLAIATLHDRFGNAPCCGVVILKVIATGHSAPVVLARMSLGLFGGYSYSLFTVHRDSVMPVTLTGSRFPVVLTTHAAAGWGEGFRCRTSFGRLAIEAYRWYAADLDARERVKVSRWLYSFVGPTAMGVRRLAPAFPSYRAEGHLGEADCRGVRDLA